MQKQQKYSCTICGSMLIGKQTKFCSNRCKNRCHQYYQNQQRRGLARKVDLIIRAGGCCSMCGYDKNLSALTFHHIKSKDKKFKLDMRTLSNRTLKSILSEHQKCILICHNCHMELHHPELALSRVLYP